MTEYISSAYLTHTLRQRDREREGGIPVDRERETESKRGRKGERERVIERGRERKV